MPCTVILSKTFSITCLPWSWMCNSSNSSIHVLFVLENAKRLSNGLRYCQMSQFSLYSSVFLLLCCLLNLLAWFHINFQFTDDHLAQSTNKLIQIFLYNVHILYSCVAVVIFLNAVDCVLTCFLFFWSICCVYHLNCAVPPPWDDKFSFTSLPVPALYFTVWCLNLPVGLSAYLTYSWIHYLRVYMGEIWLKWMKIDNAVPLLYLVSLCAAHP